MKAASVVLAVACALACGIAGFAFGQRSAAVAADFSRHQAYRQFMEAQARALASGDPRQVEEALWAQLAAFDAGTFVEMQRTSSLGATDAAFAYARLSELALAQGQSERAAWLLSRAEAQCPQIRWPSCSGPVILEAVRKVPLSSAGRPASR